MTYFLHWVIAHAISLEIVFIVSMLICGAIHILNKKKSNSVYVWSGAMMLAGIAAVLGTVIGLSAALSLYKTQVVEDPYDGRWKSAVSSIGGLNYAMLNTRECDERVTMRTETDGQLIVSLLQSAACDPKRSLVLISMDDPDPFERYIAIRIWMQLSRSADGKLTPLPGAAEKLGMVRKAFSLISEGRFPSEMTYGREGSLSFSFRQYLRDQGLVHESIFNISDIGLTSQLLFKETASIGSDLWFHMTTTPQRIDLGPGKAVF